MIRNLNSGANLPLCRGEGEEREGHVGLFHTMNYQQLFAEDLLSFYLILGKLGANKDSASSS